MLSGFDARTRASLRTFVSELAVAVDDRGPDLNSALGHAEPTAANLDRLVRVLDIQRAHVRGLVRDSATLLTAVGRREGDLQSLVTAGNDVFSATAARNRELTATVRRSRASWSTFAAPCASSTAPAPRWRRTSATRLRRLRDSLVALDGLSLSSARSSRSCAR